MPLNFCCVPGCATSRGDGVLHKFPNPETSKERFDAWVLNIGGDLGLLDHDTIYGNKRVCHRHFEEIHKYPTGRLSKLAIPILHIPGKEVNIQAYISTPAPDSSNIEATISNPLDSKNIEPLISKSALDLRNIEAILSKPSLASTSNVSRAQSNDLISGLPLHRFPNPNNPALIERFRTWVMKIGGDIIGEDNKFIHKNRKVCHKHFEDVYIFPNMKLSALAIPTLELPESSNDEQRRKQLKMREERKQFYSRRTGIYDIPEVADIIEITTSSVADDINDDEEVEVCRVCLVLDVKMYALRDNELKTMFQHISGISLNETDHVILGSVCWECAARLKAAATFRSKALLSGSLLQGLINSGEQIRKSDITTIKEKEGRLTKTLTAIEVFHIVDIEDQNVTQPLQSAEDIIQPLLSEHDDTENNIIIEIQQENPALDVEVDEINVPIQFEIEEYLCFNNREENNQDSTFSREDTINLVYSSSQLDTGVPLLETRIKTQENNPKDCTSSRENTITAAHGGPLLDVGLSSLSQENCKEQINKYVNKRNSNSEMNSKILPEQTTEPNKRRKEAIRYGRTYLKAVTKAGNKKKK